MNSLIDIIEQYAPLRLRRSGRNYRDGIEFSGPCPFCAAGTDRFRVWPDAQFPHYWCRQCHVRGGHIAFLTRYAGKTYAEACQIADIDPHDARRFIWQSMPHHIASDEQLLPSPIWRERASVVVDCAQGVLWNTKTGRPFLQYLRERGLSDETIRNQRFGLIRARNDGCWPHEPRANWGLHPVYSGNSTENDRKNRKDMFIYLPPGILIPWLCNGQIIKLSVRLLQSKQRYCTISGSCDALYNVDHLSMKQPVMMVESPFCAAIIEQVARESITSVATGSITQSKHPLWRKTLARTSGVLQAFDNDEPDSKGKCAGDEGARYWLQVLPHAVRWKPEGAKDPNEMYLQSPEQFKRWLARSLVRLQEELSIRHQVQQQRFSQNARPESLASASGHQSIGRSQSQEDVYQLHFHFGPSA